MDYRLIEEAAEWRVKFWGPVLNEALEAVGPDFFRGKRVLEIGYGKGRFAALLANLGAEVVGIESEATCRENAIEYVKNAGVADKCSFIVGDLFQLQDQFDIIVTKSVLYHIKDREVYQQWVAQIHRLLKPNGQGLFIETGSGNCLVRIYRRYIHRWHSYWNNVLSNPVIIDYFKAKFRIVDIRSHYAFSPVIPLDWLTKFEFKRKQSLKTCFIFWIWVKKEA